MAEKVRAALKASKKVDDPIRCDILELLGQLEGELQAKDIAIATLKSECLKHLLHNLRSDKGLLCDPALALNRDGTRASPTITNATSKTNANQLNDFTKKDNNCLAAAAALNNTGKGNHPNNTSTTSSDTQKLVALYNLVESQKNTLSRLSNCLDGAEKQRISLIKDLEEEREKNSQLQAQSNRILEETKSISKENAEKQTDSDSDEVAKLKATLNTERKNTKDMVLVLMEDRRKITNTYVEEVKKSNELTRLLREEKSKVRTLGVGLEEESKRSLAMEAELERHLVQINSQAEELQASRISTKELEDALRKARADAEHFKKQLTEAHRVAMSQATAAASPLYAHTEALNAAAAAASVSSTSGSGHGTSGGTGHGTSSSSISSSSTSTLSGLTASSLVTAAMGKQNMIYDNYGSTNNPSQSSSKPRSSMSSSTATMIPRGSHRQQAGSNIADSSNNSTSSSSSNSVSSTINRITNSFQVNVNGGLKKGPPVPPNKPAVSLPKPLAKFEGIVSTSDARKGAIDLAK